MGVAHFECHVSIYLQHALGISWPKRTGRCLYFPVSVVSGSNMTLVFIEHDIPLGGSRHKIEDKQIKQVSSTVPNSNLHRIITLQYSVFLLGMGFPEYVISLTAGRIMTHNISFLCTSHSLIWSLDEINLGMLPLLVKSCKYLKYRGSITRSNRENKRSFTRMDDETTRRLNSWELHAKLRDTCGKPLLPPLGCWKQNAIRPTLGLT